MVTFQLTAISLCVVLNMLDGFDVLVMSFTAPDVAKAWGLSGYRLGTLLSAGLVGMAFGALFVAPLADLWGRRTMVLISLTLLTAGMIPSAFATGFAQLGLLRVVTGLGIGTMLASISVVSSEYAPVRFKSTAVSLQATGYPIGATLGGIVAAWLISSYGWRSIFAFGGIVSGLLIPLVWVALPESLDYLLARQPRHALDRVNAVLKKLGRPLIQRLPDRQPIPSTPVTRFTTLFEDGLALNTLLIWAGFFMVMLCFYFVLTWTPRLLVAAGMSSRQGITGGVLLNLGGIVGGIAFGWIAASHPVQRMAVFSMLGAVLALLAYGYFSGELTAALICAGLAGVCVFAAMVSLYALTPRLYPAAVRTTGTGWAIGIGRLGAILAPLTAGALVDAGWQARHLYFLSAIPMLVAAGCAAALRLRSPIHHWRPTDTWEQTAP